MTAPVTTIRVLIQHWPDIVKVVEEFRENARRSMESAETERDMWKAQGAVKALNAVLALPDIIPALRGEIE